MKRTKTQLAKILLDYLDDYYTEYPEEKSEDCVNWGELDSYYLQYPDIFPVLVVFRFVELRPDTVVEKEELQYELDVAYREDKACDYRRENVS